MLDKNFFTNGFDNSINLHPTYTRFNLIVFFEISRNVYSFLDNAHVEILLFKIIIIVPLRLTFIQMDENHTRNLYYLLLSTQFLVYKKKKKKKLSFIRKKFVMHETTGELHFQRTASTVQARTLFNSQRFA